MVYIRKARKSHLDATENDFNKLEIKNFLNRCYLVASIYKG